MQLLLHRLNGKRVCQSNKKRRTSKCVCRLYRRTNSGRSKEIRNEDSSRKTGGYGCNDREDCGMFRKCEFLKI